MRFVLALLALLWAAPPAAAETEVDLELVLAVDISRSMDFEELELQREGYVRAFRDPEVIRAIRGGLLGRIAVLYLEWAGSGIRNEIGGWTLIEDADDAARFADRLEAARTGSASGTSISRALAHGAAAFEGNGFAGLRQVIDVSGDGPNNSGGGVVPARDAALAQGVTINGLPVMLKAYDGPFSLRELDVYYEDCVTGGPTSFVLPLWEAEKFPETIRRKLILEISGRTPPPGNARITPVQLGLGGAARGPRIDCLIGEKRRQRWIEKGGWDW
ncbi:MAG: DUF1194 domain-containing protein [Pseudomonadota bacterium]